MTNETKPGRLNGDLNPETQPSPGVYNAGEQTEIPHNQQADKKNKRGGKLLAAVLSTTLVGAGILGYALDGKLSIANGEKPLDTPSTEPNNAPSSESSEESTNKPVVLPTKETSIALSTRMVLGEEKIYTEKMIGFLSYAPDGQITYWTDSQGMRRFLVLGGDSNFITKEKGNSTHLMITDGTKTLEEIMASGEIDLQSFKEVYAYDENDQFRKYYAGITSVIQDPANPDHLLGTVHAENRPTRDAHNKFQATFELAESFDGGETWQDKGPFITGTDTREPGFIEGYKEDGTPIYRVTGAGQPTSIYNEKDGYAYFSWIDWRGDNAHPDQPYLARAKVSEGLVLGELEYWTTDGFSTNFDGDKLKSIIPVPEGLKAKTNYEPGKDFVYMALPKFSFNEDTGKFECIGESDLGFWRAESDNLTDWSEPEVIYNFTEHGGKPHGILKKLEKWDSYPTVLDETKPSSQRIGNKGRIYHSSGDNSIAHEPAVLDYTIQPK